MTEYGDWVTPAPRTAFPFVQMERAVLNRSLDPTGWDVATQSAMLNTSRRADRQGLSTNNVTNNIMHQEANYNNSADPQQVSGSLAIVRYTPEVHTALTVYPDNWQGADWVEIDDSGHVINYRLTFIAAGVAETFQPGDGETSQQFTSGEGSFRWTDDFEFDYDPTQPNWRMYPGDVWRDWNSVSFDSGQTVEQPLDLGAIPTTVSAAVVPNRMLTPTATPPNTGTGIPARIHQGAFLSKTCVVTYQPHRYRLVYEEGNPPPTPIAGMWHLSQRQNLSGNDGGWPLAQRHNGDITGSWPLAQRQSGH